MNQRTPLPFAIFLILILVIEAFSPVSRSRLSLQLTMRPDDKMRSTYNQLADRLISRYQNSDELRNNQLFVCIAGGPGSGKSTLAAAVADSINAKLATSYNNSGVDAAVVLPMDGFHYTRSQLQSMGESSSCAYTYEELLARRGAPWTFDAETCVRSFLYARTNASASLPIYSREKSDPIPNGVTLETSTKIVLLEGNYLLAWKDERWSPLRGIFDETWFISCRDTKEQRQRLVSRHLETWSEEKTKMWGEGEEGAGKKADANDMLNLVWIDEMSREFADLVIESI